MRQQFIHEWFSQVAENAGSAVAVVYGSQRVTYGELEERANKLANSLSAAGARKGNRVVILVDDTVRMITSIIAVLKIGGVFVPLDPSTPAARLSAMVSEVAPEWLIVESRTAGVLASTALELPQPANVIFLDREDPPALDHRTLIAVRGSIDSADSRRPPLVSEPDDMCYIYFTSGSTGKPKGIAGRLKAIDHFIRWEINTFNLGAAPRVSHVTNPAFDASLRDIFTPLCSGGTICAPSSREVVLDAPQLVRWLDDQEIQVLHCVPSLFRSIINQDLDPSRFSALSHILLAGEPLPPADVKKWMDVFGNRAQIVNLYGPSETTMVKFFHIVQPADLTRRSIPIGKPMEGARAVILDDNRKVCPAGVVGEIYIRTPYRTHGYINQPELTSQVFIQNPFNSAPGDLIYKTGDLGRTLEDGSFEFLGRKDRQVKIRGLRIELAEIEDVLRRHSAIKDVVVVDRTDCQGQAYLCAFVVANQPIEASALREHLLPQLPEYMVPSAFVALDSLPRTSTGKIDIKALPAVDRTGPAGRGTYIAPRTPVEEVLANLWADVLKIERVSVNESFFELGGHSLIATQVISRVRDAFHLELPLRTLFEKPTVAAFADIVEQALKSDGGAKLPALVPLQSRVDLPLSFSQQRLWFLAQLEPNSPAYNIPAAVRVKGSLNVTALSDALNEIIRRHEVLRTRFVQADGVPVQRIDAQVKLAIPIIDLTGLPPASRETRAFELAAEEARKPFSLEHPPLVRASVLKLSEDESLLLFTMHHIVSDGWSMGVLVEELSTLYAQFVSGTFSPMPSLQIQYGDFASWQRQWLQGKALEEHLDYWRTQLQGSANVELPTDRPRPSEPSFKGASVSFVVPKAVAQKLTEVSRKHEATLFMTLLSAFKALLGRYTGQDDISVGTPIANRNQTGVEGLIGCFVNMLVLRTALSGDPEFAEVLARVREVALGAYAHQDIPFEKLVEALRVDREKSRSPLFNVVFALQNTPRRERQLPGITLKLEEIDRGTAKFDLELLMTESHDGLLGIFEYNTDLFDHATIAGFADHFQNMLEYIATDPNQRLSMVTRLPVAQRLEMLVARNNTVVDYGSSDTFQPLFEAQVERTPEAVAIKCGQEQLTYRELNQRANRLAHALVEAGAGPETLVGLLSERGLDFLTAMLAVFKAGASYLPLNPAYPSARIAELIEQSQCPLVLVGDGLAGALSDKLPQERILSIREADSLARPANNLPDTGFGNSLAYVIYTSGSTGLPKGAMVEQAGMVNHLYGKLKDLEIHADDVVAQNAPQSFDISIWQYLAPLLVGATVVVVPDEEAGDPSRLLDRLQADSVSVLEVVPSLMRSLVETVEQAGPTRWKLPFMRWIVPNGEALPPRLCRQWLGLFPHIPIVNAYGTTECSDDATHHRIEDLSFDDALDSMPLGKTMGNLRVYVLDKNLEPGPVGVPGEIYIGGIGVGRGYLGRPDLTAERFIPDPFSGEPGARLYKTGDLARYTSDGSLLFVGRTDHQVKVRGHRIELGEIEAALAKHADVKEATVLAEGSNEDKRLIAYLVLNQSDAVSMNDLRKWLKERLPGYMVPGQMVSLTSMPLNANGKVDRKALAALPKEALAEAGYLAPRDALELEALQIFSEVLGVRGIGMKDSFFDLGGHSLLAVTLVARIQQKMGRTLPLTALLDGPTVEEVASLLREEQASKPDSMLVPIQPKGRKRPFYCIHPTGGNVLCYYELAQNLGSDQPFYGLQAHGLHGGQIFARIEDIAAASVKTMRAHQPVGPYLLGGWSFGGIVAFEMARQLKQQGESVDLLVLVDTPKPVPRPVHEHDDVEVMLSLADAIGKYAGKQLTVPIDELRHLSSDDQLLYMLELAKKEEALPVGIDLARARQYLQVAHSNEVAEQTYVAGVYDGRITLFRASDDPAFSPDAKDGGWGALSTEEINVRVIPGDHHNIMRAPHVQILADQLKSCLEQVQTAQPWVLCSPPVPATAESYRDSVQTA
jgi:amino acid adenylation domain-containing protein